MSTANQFSFWMAFSLYTALREERVPLSCQSHCAMPCQLMLVIMLTVTIKYTQFNSIQTSRNWQTEFSFVKTAFALNLWHVSLMSNQQRPPPPATTQQRNIKSNNERKRTDELVAHANNGTTNLFFNEIEKQWSLALIIKKHQLFGVFQ